MTEPLNDDDEARSDATAAFINGFVAKIREDVRQALLAAHKRGMEDAIAMMKEQTK